jgi:hypothetical protein
MQLLNKTILLASFNDIRNLLELDLIKNNCLSNNIAVKHYINNSLNIIRIWNITSISNYLYQDFTLNNFIIAVDYRIELGRVKIEYLNINDKEYIRGIKNINFLNKYDVYEITRSMLIFIENMARKNNKNKIVIDVHNSLINYNKYYKEFFKITSRKCLDNPYWIEVEKTIYQDLNYL